MKKASLFGCLGLLALLALFIRDYIQSPEPQANVLRVLYYRDPMHPSFTSPNPGKAPDCGMDLEPVYDTASSVQQAGIVQIADQAQKAVGIRMSKVEVSPVTRTFRTVGRVAPDEARMFPVIAGTEGWVTTVHAGPTGSKVQKGQPLASVYGRDYTNAQRTFLYALRTLEIQSQVAVGNYQDQPALLVREARLALENMGMGETQIQQIVSSREVALAVTLAAPTDGVIVARNVSPGQKFDRGSELFRIADLSRVWVVADVNGEEIHYLDNGVTARASVPGGTAIPVIVSQTLPSIDSPTRSQKVRLVAENRGLILLPGMFVDLEFSVNLPRAMTIPAEAILNSGLAKTVFVERAQGMFETRIVETGFKTGDRVQILRGLDSGESVLVSGTFLMDSERRIHQGVARPHD